MKRILLAVLIAVPVTLSAAPVGRRAAYAAAREFLASKSVSLNAENTPYRAPLRGTSSADDAAYYVFNVGDGQGYVIVSGDDRTPQVLGYVPEGNFDEASLPENMRAWLQACAAQIQSLDDNGATDGEAANTAAHARRLKKVHHAVPTMLTTTWAQGSPYNQNCPSYLKDDGTEATPVTGCVATAFAQVMNYYQWPAATTADIPDYAQSFTLTSGTTVTLTRIGFSSGTAIDWANMLDSYSGSPTDAQTEAVATLMRLCGQAVRMSYGSTSSATTQHCVEAAVRYFGYDESVRWVVRNNCSSEEEWFEMLYDELAAGYPVIYDGHTPSGGHAFVLDGFDGDNLFHVNWGWGGLDNGRFMVTSLCPSDSDNTLVSSDAGGYTMGSGAMLGLRKPDSDYVGKDYHVGISNITIDGEKISARYSNNTGSAASFVAAIAIAGEDGTYSPVTATQKYFRNVSHGVWNAHTHTLTGLLSEGTYRLMPVMKVSGTTMWEPAYDGVNNYIRATVDAAGAITLEAVAPAVDLSVEKVSFPAPRQSGTSQQVLAVIRNGGDEFYGRIALYGGLGEAFDYLGSKMTARIPKGGTSVESFTFTPSGTGTFNVAFCSEDGATVYGSTTVAIGSTSTSPTADLAVEGFTMDNCPDGENVYANWIGGTMQVGNNAREDFMGSVKLQLYRKTGTSTYNAVAHVVRSVYVPAVGTASVPFCFEGLTSMGRSYCIEATYVNWSSNATLDDGARDKTDVYATTNGMIYWDDGGESGASATTTPTGVPDGTCGAYLIGTAATSMTTGDNSNTIYYVESGAKTPSGLSGANLVVNGTAERIALTDDDGYGFFVPKDFTATEATFTHKFPATADGTAWEALTMPFDATTITAAGVSYRLSDGDKPFAIYEFTGVGSDGLPAFAPASVLRGGTPYLLAASSALAGERIVFGGTNVKFYRMADTERTVSDGSFTWHGTSVVNDLPVAYELNAAGTAFVGATRQDITAWATYFTTTLPAGSRPTSIALCSVPALSNAAGDMTLVDGIYQIRTGAGLKAFSDLVNGSGPTDNAYRGASAVLLNDIDMTGVADFHPIGSYYAKGEQIHWYGTFDGQGHTISNLNLSEADRLTTYDGVALFCHVASGAVIKNLTLDATCSFTSSSGRVASFVAYCGYVGKAGTDEVVLENCVNRATVTCTNTSTMATGTNGAGGLVASIYIGGNGYGTISKVSLLNCRNEGNVNGHYRVGGLVGYVYNTAMNIVISRCSNTGTITGGQYTGGLLGSATGNARIINSYNTGAVSGTSASAALAGQLTHASSLVANCWNTGSVTAGITAHQTLYGTSGGTLLASDANNWDLSGSDAATLHPAPAGYTAEWLASGQLCYHLNLTAGALVYYQNLGYGGDALPVLDATHGLVLNCSGTYSVNESDTALPVLYDASYHIADAQDLVDFAAVVNHGIIYANAVVDEDIDMTGTGDFTPISDVFSNWVCGYGNWCGTFDGQGHTISHMQVHKNSRSAALARAALFGNVSAGATIKNLTLDGTCSFESDYGVAAGFVGYVGYEGATTASAVQLENLTNHAAVTSSVAAGGIVALGYTGNTGSNFGYAERTVQTLTLDNCKNYGAVTNSASSEAQGYGTGGLIGYGETPTTNLTGCRNGGNVSGTGTSAGTGTGGLVGVSYKTFYLTDCTNTGTITSTQDKVGGMVGRGYGASVIHMTRCTNSGAVTGEKNHVGGLVGLTGGSSVNSFDACSNSGAVTGVQSVGGLLGQQNSGTATLENCSNTGAVESTGIYTGGLLGNNASTSLTLTDCTNGNSVHSTNANVGGLIGYFSPNGNGTLDITRCSNTGMVSTSLSSATLRVGGLVGWLRGVSGNTGNVVKCWNTGEIKGTGSSKGTLAGLVGVSGGSTLLTLTDCYNTGVVTGTTIAGTLATGTPTTTINVTNCWNSGTVTGSGTNGGTSLLGRTGTGTTGAYTLSNTYDLVNTNADNGAPDGYTSEWLENGHFCYYINDVAGSTVYYQSVGTGDADDTPVLNSGHGQVYQVTTNGNPYYVNEGGTLAAMTLVDAQDYAAPVAFSVTSLTYGRTLAAGGYHSLCLPFAISQSMFSESGGKLFTLDDIGESSVTLSEVDEVAAGVPCFASVSSTYSFPVQSGVEMVESVADASYLKGSFANETIGSGCYKLDATGTRFGITTASGTVTAFRNYLQPTGSSVKTLNIQFADGTNVELGPDFSPTGTEADAVYDLQGRRVERVAKGVYIVNGKKVVGR